MKSNLLLTLLITTVCLFHSGLSYASQEKGNGADTSSPEHGSAWFLGQDKTVNYCVKVSKTFGLPENQVQRTVYETLEQWHQYLLTHQHSLGSVNLTSNFRNVPCGTGEDVAFLFGIKNRQIEKAKLHYVNPVAFSERVSYDSKIGWSKGFVWFASHLSVKWDNNNSIMIPNWKRENALHAVLLHEIGHMLGCEHVEGTIMAKDINLSIQHDGPKILRQIDQQRMLMLDTLTLDGTLGGQDRFDDQFILKPHEIFEELMGRKPVGEIRSSIWASFELLNPGSHLTIADDISTRAFQLDISKNGSRNFMGPTIFKSFLIGKGTFISSDHGVLQYGTLTRADGTKIPISVEVNLAMDLRDAGPIEIKKIVDDGAVTLFRTSAERN